METGIEEQPLKAGADLPHIILSTSGLRETLTAPRALTMQAIEVTQSSFGFYSRPPVDGAAAQLGLASFM